MKRILAPVLLASLFLTCEKFKEVVCVRTLPVTLYTSNTATLSGTIVDPGQGIKEYGHIVWKSGMEGIATRVATKSTATGSFSNVITGLEPGATYVVKAFATDGGEDVTGETVSFTTHYEINNFTDDRDGHIYKSIRIGDQIWMAENLAYLPAVSPPSQQSDTEPFYYVNDYYSNNLDSAKASGNYTDYGVLYNWPAAMNGAASSTSSPSGVQGVCPSGWHVPSQVEFRVLINEAGGTDLAGGKLKESGFLHWLEPNTGATDSYGFAALPGGCYWYTEGSGYFGNKSFDGFWWTSTERIEINARYIYLWGLNYSTNDATLYGDYKNCAYSVRCVKD